MSTAHAHPTVIPDVQSAPVLIPASRREQPVRPTAGHDHQWVINALFKVDPHLITEASAAWMAGGTPPGIPMDYDALINIVGPICLKCNQKLTPSTAVMPCPVVLVPVLGVAR